MKIAENINEVRYGEHADIGADARVPNGRTFDIVLQKGSESVLDSKFDINDYNFAWREKKGKRKTTKMRM
jgi:hypothetical protein